MFVSVLVWFLLVLSSLQPAYSSQQADLWRKQYHTNYYTTQQGELEPTMVAANVHGVDRSFQSRLLGAVNLDTLYTFMTSDSTVIQMYITVIVQFITQTVGWLVTSALWNTARGSSPGGVDLGALQTFAFSPQTAATSTAVGLGYTVTTTLVNFLFGSVGGISTISRESTERISGKQGGIDYLVTQMDNKTQLQSIANQTAVNFILTLGFVLFWFVMSLMPNSSRRRSEKPTIWRGHEILESAVHFLNTL
jgi:hypothetical protein